MRAKPTRVIAAVKYPIIFVVGDFLQMGLALKQNKFNLNNQWWFKQTTLQHQTLCTAYKMCLIESNTIYGSLWI